MNDYTYMYVIWRRHNRVSRNKILTCVIRNLLDFSESVLLCSIVGSLSCSSLAGFLGSVELRRRWTTLPVCDGAGVWERSALGSRDIRPLVCTSCGYIKFFCKGKVTQNQLSGMSWSQMAAWGGVVKVAQTWASWTIFIVVKAQPNYM